MSATFRDRQGRFARKCPRCEGHGIVDSCQAPCPVCRGDGIAPAYTAPADQLLTNLHKDAGDGTTVCGLEMRTDSVWLPVERRDGDQVCRGCEGEPEPVMEEAGLW